MRGFARVLRRELRRGPAAALAVTVAGSGMVVLFGGSQAVEWQGRWLGLAEAVRQLMVVAVPLTVGASCWALGRPRRRGTLELLASAPRPGWQAQAAPWAGAWLGGLAGLGLLFGVGAAFVAPVASYAGGGWWWAVLVAVPSLASVAAFGAAVGAWSPWRGTAPVLALLLYAAVTLLGLGANGGALSPAGRFLSPDTLITIDVPAAQLAWFGGVTLALLGLAAMAARPASRRSLAGALVLGALVALPSGWWLREHRDDDAPLDPAALALVCTPDEPRVCLHRVDAFALDDVAPRAQALLRRLAPVAGTPRRVLPFDVTAASATAPDGVLVVGRPDVDVRGHLRAEDAALTGGENDVSPLFESPTCTWAGDETLRNRRAGLVSAAVAWSLQRPPAWPTLEESEAWDALRSLPAARQVAFVQALVVAREQCSPEDVARLRALLGLS